jgi:lysine-N-methylase
MKLYAPQYYKEFHCIADACRHTCCEGWEIDIDEDRLTRFRQEPYIAAHIEEGDPPHFRLLEGERCPFLKENGLCEMILRYGEDILCQICRDHPRFRSFWSDRVELGLGLVCEEAGRLILGSEEPMKLVCLSDDGEETELPEDEAWLMDLRERFLQSIAESGPKARLMEYLIYRHLPDALYDDRVEQRIAFIRQSYEELTAAWEESDESLDAMVEICRVWSYDVEYDDEELERRIANADRR